MTKDDAKDLKHRLWDATMEDEHSHEARWDSGLWVRFKFVTAVIDAYVEEMEKNDER